jgi:hypothetical protein
MSIVERPDKVAAVLSKTWRQARTIRYGGARRLLAEDALF